MRTQLNWGQERRVMYVENKSGDIDGVRGRIGWVSFSRTGQTVYYRGRSLQRGGGVSGNFFNVDTGEEYWTSGVMKRGSNAHWAEAGVTVEVNPDALEAYRSIRAET